MALQTIPGQNGFIYGRYSSMDKRALGKFTDSNHLQSLHMSEPTQYDKAIVTIYTQSSLFADDFEQMINKAKPFYLTTNSDYFQWDVDVPFAAPKIIEIPSETQNMSKVGIDGQEFSLVLDTAEFSENDVITSHRIYAQEFAVISDPQPYNAGYLYRFVLLTANPKVDFVPKEWLQVGIELEKINNLVSQDFDTKLSGLGRLGDKITLFESMSSAYGVQHKVTKAALGKSLKDKNGNPLDIIFYAQDRRNEPGQKYTGPLLWESFIDSQVRRELLKMRAKRRIWGKGGTFKTRGAKQEIKRNPKGVYHQIRNNGHLARYPKGGFSLPYLRDIFGDLFYRRVPMERRRVKLYTNEAGMEVFRTAVKRDALGSGLTIIADDRFIQGRQQKMILNWGFDGAVTAETGNIEVVHLMELDLPQLNTEFGRNKKSTPIFLVFNVSPESDGTLVDNIREVRHQNDPNMTFGYVDGRVSHLGLSASVNMNSANMNPWYEVWMEDRSDVHIEDLSKTFIIEEIPQL